MELTFVKFEKIASRQNPNGRKECTICKCCGATIGNVVTLSDNNVYGIDCALNLQSLSDKSKKQIKDSAKEKKYKYFVCLERAKYEWESDKKENTILSRHTWITASSEEEAVKKFRQTDHPLFISVQILRTIEK